MRRLSLALTEEVEETSYRCDEATLWLPSAPGPGASWSRRCTAGATREESVAEGVGPEAVRARGDPVEAVRVRVELTLAGRTRGAGAIEAWLLTRSLRNRSPRGARRCYASHVTRRP